MYWDIEERSQEDHRQVMEKLSQAVKVAESFAANIDSHDFVMDFHADRYGDVKLTVRATKKSPMLPHAFKT